MGFCGALKVTVLEAFLVQVSCLLTPIEQSRSLFLLWKIVYPKCSSLEELPRLTL